MELFKLINNNVFGMTMEKFRKRVHVDLVRGSEIDRLRKLVADSAYLSQKKFNCYLAAIQSTKA